MEWLLDNLKLVVFVIIIVVYALKAMRDKAEADKPQGPGTRPADESAEAERTRQIQEEIRRRILARQRGEAPPASPPPVIVEEREEPEPLPRPIEFPPPVPAEVHEPAFEPVDDARQRDAAILEAQRALEEQLRLVRAAREAASAGVPSIAVPGAATAGTHRSTAARRGFRADLAGRGSLRRAIVLREILGEPVGLRSGPAGMTRR